MEPETAIEASREAIKVCFMVGGPILGVCLIVGLLMGLAQAMSHIQDQALATVPKILAIMAVIGLALPWFADRMMEFSKDQFSRPFMAETASASWTEPQPNTVHSLLSEPNNENYYPQLQVPAKQASFQKQIQSEPTLPEAKPALIAPEPSSSPFSLPSYRFSRKPNGNIEG